LLSIKSLISGSIKRLSHVFRYSSLPVTRRESVAEHTCFVALFSFAIAKDLEAKGEKVDYGKLLKSALLHDIDESLSGDFLRCVKYGVPGLHELLDLASTRFIDSIQTQLGIDLIHDWKDAKDSTLEGWIVSVADLLEVVSYIQEELASGNKHVSYILFEVGGYFDRLERTCPYALGPYIKQIINIVNSLKQFYYDPSTPSLIPAEDAYVNEDEE